MRSFILLLIVCFGFAGSAYAHPPRRIDIKITTGTIDMTIIHQVSDPVNHYINKVEVSVNGVKMIDQKFTIQNDLEKQSALYYIPGLKKGDKVEVYAVCNKGGDLLETALVN